MKAARLVVALQRLWAGVVHHEAHIRLVDACACVRGYIYLREPGSSLSLECCCRHVVQHKTHNIMHMRLPCEGIAIQACGLSAGGSACQPLSPMPHPPHVAFPCHILAAAPSRLRLCCSQARGGGRRTHAKRNGGDDDLHAIVRPGGLHLLALLLRQRCVVVAARAACPRQLAALLRSKWCRLHAQDGQQ